jgi:lipopolysaccharide assembly outer membrane protein LptD (OstA)
MLIRCVSFPLILLLMALAGVPAASAQTASAPALDRNEARRLAAPPAVATPSGGPAERVIPSEASRNRLEQLRESLNPAVEGAATVNIRAFENYLDFDKDRQIFYSPGRTRVDYGQYSIEADRLIYDQRLQEVQAEGNVTLKFRETTIHADSMRYNLRNREGSAQNVNGQFGPVYFRMAKQAAGAPQFQRVSENESIFRNTSVTTCDFKIPHYFIRGREVILYQNDRVFFRGATVYVSGVPILYLPVYTRSLVEPSPWSIQLGYGSRTGARARSRIGAHHRFFPCKPVFG